MIGPAPLQRPGFRSLWVAGLISDTGDWLLFIALPVVVYQLTGSALGTSLAFLVELAPGIVLAPLAGWCADRWNRRRLLLAVSGLQAAGLTPLLFVHGSAELTVIYAVMLIEAALLALFDPAKNALLPTLVQGADLVSANALIGLGQNLARLAGGPLGGVLLAVGGLRLVVIADLSSYVIAVALIAGIAAPAGGRAVQAGIESSQRTPGRGFYRSLLRRRPLRVVLMVTLISQAAQGVFVVLFVLFVVENLHGGPSQVGLYRGVQAVGAIAGGLTLVAVARRYPPALLAAVSAVVFGLIDLVLWNASLLTTNAALYLALFTIMGAPGVVFLTALTSIVQTHTADDERGRAFGAFGLTANLGQAAGMIAAGLLAAPFGLITILNAQAVLYLAAGGLAACSIRHRAGRHRDTPSAATTPPPDAEPSTTADTR